jgi:hypothetical protein
MDKLIKGVLAFRRKGPHGPGGAPIAGNSRAEEARLKRANIKVKDIHSLQDVNLLKDVRSWKDFNLLKDVNSLQDVNSLKEMDLLKDTNLFKDVNPPNRAKGSSPFKHVGVLKDIGLRKKQDAFSAQLKKIIRDDEES